MDRGAWQAIYSPRGLKRVQHGFVTKLQQQQCSYLFNMTYISHTCLYTGIIWEF